MAPPKGDVSKKADPKAHALKAAKAMKSGTAIKKKAKKIRQLLHSTCQRHCQRRGTPNTVANKIGII
jgi:hypothetical protein